MGSTLIENVGFRDAFVLIGQLGLEEKNAIEFVSSPIYVYNSNGLNTL